MNTWVEKWMIFVTALLLVGCGSGGDVVTVYTSQDQVYAEPILREFEQQTGIAVRAVYDSEAVKTVGLVNRLIAEKANPQCDLFWNNEEFRTHQLASMDVLDEGQSVETFGARTRQWVWNTNQLSRAALPKDLLSLTNTLWRGKVVIALPLFGSTATHFQVLRQQWGENAMARLVPGVEGERRDDRGRQFGRGATRGAGRGGAWPDRLGRRSCRIEKRPADRRSVSFAGWVFDSQLDRLHRRAPGRTWPSAWPSTCSRNR